MIILGIDPGTVITGYGIIECKGPKLQALDYGCIKPPYKESLHKRYLIIFQSLEFLIEKYKPNCMSIETQYVQKNIQSAMKLGMARGISILAATKRDIPIFEYTPSKAKKSTVGSGRASKKQVGFMIKKLIQGIQEDLPEDAADALCLAYCHFLNQKDFSGI